LLIICHKTRTSTFRCNEQNKIKRRGGEGQRN